MMLMHWPPVEALESALPLPDGISVCGLSRAQLLRVPTLIEQWYPTATVGSESVFCDPDFLVRHVVHEENRDADIFACRIEQDGEWVGFMSFERQLAAATLHARLGFIAPDARAGFLGALGFLLFEQLGALVHAELLLSWVTLARKHQQLFAKRRGFRLVGVVPGFDRDRLPDGTTKRVTEALYAKSLVPLEELAAPDDEALTPEVSALLELVQRA